MPLRFEDVSNFNIGNQKDFLIREADEAFNAEDKASCVNAIDQLYDLLDDTWGSLRRGRRPPW